MSQGIERVGSDGITYYARRDGNKIIVASIDARSLPITHHATHAIARELLGEHEALGPNSIVSVSTRRALISVIPKPAPKFVPYEDHLALIELHPSLLPAIELEVLPGEEDGVFYVGRVAAIRILEIWKDRVAGGRRAYHFTNGRDIVFVDTPGGQIEINEWPESYSEDMYRLDFSPFPYATVTPL